MQEPVLTVGRQAPPLVMPDTEGNTVDLRSYRGRRHVVLYFMRALE